MKLLKTIKVLFKIKKNPNILLLIIKKFFNLLSFKLNVKNCNTFILNKNILNNFKNYILDFTFVFLNIYIKLNKNRFLTFNRNKRF